MLAALPNAAVVVRYVPAQHSRLLLDMAVTSYLLQEDFVSVVIVAMEKQANCMNDVRTAFR